MAVSWFEFGVGAAALIAVLARTFLDLKWKEPPFGSVNFWRGLFMGLTFVALLGIARSIDKSRRNAEESLQRFNATVNEIQREGRRIRPGDIQLRVYMYAPARYRQTQSPLPPVHVEAKLGAASVSFELVDLGPAAGEQRPVGRAGGGDAYRFVATNLIVFNLESVQFLEDLNSKSFDFEWPTRQLNLPEGAWYWFVDLYVRGHRFSGTVDSDRKVRIPIANLPITPRKEGSPVAPQ